MIGGSLRLTETFRSSPPSLVESSMWPCAGVIGSRAGNLRGVCSSSTRSDCMTWLGVTTERVDCAVSSRRLPSEVRSPGSLGVMIAVACRPVLLASMGRPKESSTLTVSTGATFPVFLALFCSACCCCFFFFCFLLFLKHGSL